MRSFGLRPQDDILCCVNPYCHLAKQAIEYYLKNGATLIPPDDLSSEFYTQRSGVFVTIENNGQLRGCIGTYLPSKENVAQEIINNAIAAATCDNRFNPVNLNELDNLSLAIYLLNPPEQIQGLEKLDAKIYGLLVKSFDHPYKSGLLLPDLEGIDTPEKQFMIACQKAGIDPTKENIELYRFDVEKYQ